MKKLDLTNKKFGLWTAIKYAGQYECISNGKKGGYALWTCRCKCGITKEVSLSALRSGTSTNCGCQKANKCRSRYLSSDPQPGDIIHNVMIIKRVEDTRSKSGRINKRFLVKCKCENHFITHKSSLKVKNLTCEDCGRLKAARNRNTSKTLFHWKDGSQIDCVGSYEFKVVNWLNLNKIEFTWKPKTFLLPSGRKYTPDLYIDHLASYVEVKGWWWNSKSYYDEFVISNLGKVELWDQKKLKQMKLI